MKPHNLLLSALLLGATTAFAAAGPDARLVGAWAAADANNGALRGTITLEKSGVAILAAEAQPVLQGTWQVPAPGTLKLTMGEYGSSLMKYRLEKKKLVLVYDNGNEQSFNKSTPQKAPSK